MVGRKYVQKRSVTKGHQKRGSFSHCTFLHCISCAYKMYAKQTYRIYSKNMNFENSINFKNLRQFLDFHNILFKMTVKLTKNVLILINE